MSGPADGSRHIAFDDVSKFYGEVLGVNRVHLAIAPGITSLVGPNGSGKSTLMNLMTGLLRPSRGRVSVLGRSPDEPEGFFRQVGYCTQFDRFPRGLSGRQFVLGYLRVHGYPDDVAIELADDAIERVGMTDAARRRVAGYSKGMRQRIKLAQAIAHHPPVLVLDEPLNGLDPMARAEVIELFRELAHEDRHVIISSHILHEVDLISDTVVILNQGYVVAEGDIRSVRSEIRRHPMQILLRSPQATDLAAVLLRSEHVVEIKMHEDRAGLLVKTQDADAFYLEMNEIVRSTEMDIETITPADEDVHAVYRYLVGDDGEAS
jgi:ABC-2 type transport system ATP-binding protein